jgi:predicted DNA-binding antitoxin AbrB/MazE fold protein
MSITVEAVYEDGVLKPVQPLPLKDRDKVRVTIESVTSPLLQAYGIMGFTGTAKEADWLALSPELDPNEDE